MTSLNRTDLPTSLKVQLAASALAGQEKYGVKTELARLFEVSRPTVYAAGQTAADTLERHFLADECGARTITVDERQLQRAIGALRVVAPNSIRAIETLIPSIYPGVHVSYGKIQYTLIEQEQRAAWFNASVDLSNVDAGALDEMFSQGAPVLAGVDLDSGYLFSLALRESRGEQDWAEVLQEAKQQGLELTKVVKDAAKGIAAGVKKVFPNAEQRDDCFHAFYEMGKLKRRLEQRGYNAIANIVEAEKKLGDIRRTGRGNRNERCGTLGGMNKKCNKLLRLHDAYEVAMREVIEVMEFVDVATGTIRTAKQMERSIIAAAEKMIALGDCNCVKVGKYIRNRAAGLALYMNELSGELDTLAKQYGEVPVRLASVIYRLGQDLEHERRPWDRHRDKQHLLGAWSMLRGTTGCRIDELLDDLDSIMQRRHRASSAIEGFNAALRPFLYVHKGVTKGFLELFRAYYNLRTRRWGRHKGTSAHHCLTGEPIKDWLTTLGYPPTTPIN